MAYTKKQTLKYVFSEKHKEYIRSCVSCEFNVAEGAVRAGKTVDNVYAFAHELKIAPDRIHLATGSTVGNANNKNPIAVIIPCHRVIGANGTLTGYAENLVCQNIASVRKRNGK